MALDTQEAPASRPDSDLRVTVTEITEAGEARRLARSMTQEAGFDGSFCNNAAILVSELATNLARYATAGEILLQIDTSRSGSCLNVWSIDRGPGIADVSRSLVDGYSTGGTPGNGLGAVQRLATSFDVYSAQPGGTVVFARLQHRGQIERRGLRYGAVCQPMRHETACGDMCRICEQDGILSAILVDGLGHGPEAAAAAREAIAAFSRDPFTDPATIVTAVDSRMRGTRGGAVAIAKIDFRQRLLRYVGVGNISGSLRDANGAAGRGLFSHHGIVGVQIRKIQEFEYQLPSSGFLVMHSDGLQSRWSFEKNPGLMRRCPEIIAGILYRDFTRDRDDVTVAVVEIPAAA